MLRLDAEELVTRLSMSDDPFAGEALVAIEGPPPADALVLLAGVPAVVIGIDVVPRSDAELAAVEHAVSDHPDAAISLAILLRAAVGRSVGEGLAAESAVYSMLQAAADHRRWLATTSRRGAGSGASAPILTTRRGDALRITLNEPDRRNAFSAAMRDALAQAIMVAAADPAVLVTIDGAGPAFCSGGDLDEFGSAGDPAVAHAVRLRRSVGRAIAAIADRVTVQVHGACVGAGVELPAFAARRRAS